MGLASKPRRYCRNDRQNPIVRSPIINCGPVRGLRLGRSISVSESLRSDQEEKYRERSGFWSVSILICGVELPLTCPAFLYKFVITPELSLNSDHMS